MVSQLSRGTSLDRLMGPPVQGNDPQNPTRRRPLEALRVVRLFRRLVGALARIHRQGLVHGRVTPAGVYVEGPGETDIVLKWQSVTNRWYTIERTIDLTTGFMDLESDIPGTPPVNIYWDTTATNKGPYFYKARVRQ